MPYNKEILSSVKKRLVQANSNDVSNETVKKAIGIKNNGGLSMKNVSRNQLIESLKFIKDKVNLENVKDYNKAFSIIRVTIQENEWLPFEKQELNKAINEAYNAIKPLYHKNKEQSTNLADIIKNDAVYMGDVTVKIQRNMPSVTISDNNAVQEDIYLQGDDAYTFIKEVDDLSDKCPDANFEDIELSVAKQYVENIWY